MHCVMYGIACVCVCVCVCAGELPLLLAPGIRRCRCGWSRGGIRKISCVSEEGEQPWRHHREEAGSGGERRHGHSQGSDPPPNNGMASPGATPPLCYAGSGGSPQQGPEEQSQQTHCHHVQVCICHCFCIHLRKPFCCCRLCWKRFHSLYKLHKNACMGL